MGKTTLASVICQEWMKRKPVHPVFWFTVRVGLNDRLEGLLYALGYFLHSCGASTLWLEMVATTGKIKTGLALDIVRNAAAELAERHITPLFCIDEVDLLRTAENTAHAQLLSFVQGLQGIVPMLLVGQQPLVDADTYIELIGLNQGEISQFLRQADVKLTTDERAILHQHTGGNPRLLHLFTALHDAGEPIESVLAALGNTPPLEYLLGRMLRRLSTQELALLKVLSVYRRPAPLRQNSDSLQGLLRRRLVQMYGQETMGILPAYRAAIFENTPTEQRQQMHQQAAEMRAGIGDYTAAAWHLIAAGNTELAIALWYDHRRQEVNSGQGQAALTMFRAVDQSNLTDDSKHILAQIRADLEQLTGDPAQALADIRWLLANDDVTVFDAYALAGYIANEQGLLGEAEEYFHRLKERAEMLVTKQLAVAHRGFNWRAIRESNLDTAWTEAQITRYEAENFQGLVQQMLNNFAEAETYYFSALQLAEEINHAEGISRTAYNLAAIYSFCGRFEEAKFYYQRGEEVTERIGKIALLLGGRINKAVLYSLSGDYAEAVTILRQTESEYELYDSLYTSREKALLNQALAEAYLSLGDWDNAKKCARCALDTEETDTRADSLRTFGEALLACGQLENAKDYIIQSISLAKEQGIPFLIGYGWRALAQIYKAMGNEMLADIARENAIEQFTALRLEHEVQKTLDLLTPSS